MLSITWHESTANQLQIITNAIAIYPLQHRAMYMSNVYTLGRQ